MKTLKSIDSVTSELDFTDNDFSFDFGDFDINDFVNSDFDVKELKDFDFEDLEFDINDFITSVDENSTNFKLDENLITQKRIEYLDQKITPLLISLIQHEDFEFGKKNEGVRLIEEQLKFNFAATQNWFNRLYIKYFARDEKILIGLLRIVESLEEQCLHPTGEIMAIAALSHKNDEIKELGVRIFENWCTLNSYELLRNIKVDTLWLQMYIDQVVNDIKVELCLY